MLCLELGYFILLQGGPPCAILFPFGFSPSFSPAWARAGCGWPSPWVFKKGQEKRARANHSLAPVFPKVKNEKKLS